MKHIKNFNSFGKVDESFESDESISAKIKQSFANKLKTDPNFQRAVAKLKDEWNKLSSSVKDRLKSLASESPEQIKSQVQSVVKESYSINESIGWKELLPKIFKALGIAGASIGFITTIAGVITMGITGTGLTSIGGIEAGTFTSIGMGTIAAAIIPLCISTFLQGDDEETPAVETAQETSEKVKFNRNRNKLRK